MSSSRKFIATVRRWIATKRHLIQMVSEAGSPRLCTLLHSIVFSLSQPVPSLPPVFPQLSSYFCTAAFIHALDSVVQELLSQCAWDLQGRLAFELFTTLSVLFAQCELGNDYANVSIAVRVAETVEYFGRCFAPLEVQLKAIFNLQSVKLALENEAAGEAVSVMKDLADIRAYWGDLEGLFYVNFALGQAYYQNRSSAASAQLCATYLQRALNCAKQVYAFTNSPTGLNPSVLCQLFLSDLGFPTVSTPPLHCYEGRTSELLALAGFDTESTFTEPAQEYVITTLEELQADEDTLQAYFRSSAGSKQVLFLYKYSVVEDD